ncbi:hypothetical protein Q31b_03100 [Novipirellula aureliae]|uniref:3-oxo-tetronate kinase n=1 Tax=Novipirellula aureliae TaxID=2527966 RepID=A0A5C6ED48_9BACT|nr:3-oxo-tetronate kinase [Novipirellula aureliae]TWU45139.1 hypothetical protein Q31b_03100 [Novipirellula aureliae]
MTSQRLGCIADDYTGATDLCSMLVRSGRRVVQCFGVPELASGQNLSDADAVVVALKSRSIPAPEAVDESLSALRFLQSWGGDRFFFKYCSTFDSTKQGNIGPVADALGTALDVDRLMFCPAFPENGRTVHCGHLFVDGVPLSESGMRNHPLNPMTDSNLVRVLQAQTSHSVGWLSTHGKSANPNASRIIVDAITDDDLRAVADIASSERLLTGGSAIARYWADAAQIRCSGGPTETRSTDHDKGPCVILAGSCSDATRTQVAEFEQTHPVLHLNVADTANIESIAGMALKWCSNHWNRQGDQPPVVLISSAENSQAVDAARQQWGEREAAERTEAIFALISVGLREQGITRLIVAGGETSGTVVAALKIPAVRIGREIAPGVPWVTSIGEPTISLALKSGNFGGKSFFFDALETSP